MRGSPPRRARVVEAPVPTLSGILERIDRTAREAEARLARLVPSAFWLRDDGTTLHHRNGSEEEAPTCPSSCDAPVLVIRECGGSATMWSCTLCGIDYDQNGRAGLRGMFARSCYERSMRRDREAKMREDMRRAMEEDR